MSKVEERWRKRREGEGSGPARYWLADKLPGPVAYVLAGEPRMERSSKANCVRSQRLICGLTWSWERPLVH